MHRRRWKIAWCLCAGLCLGLIGADAEAPQVYALQNARLVRVSGPVIEAGTIVIRDGVIAAAGVNVPVPADAWVMDARGLTVYPGLIDALSTWGVPGLAPPPPAPAGGRGGPRPAVPPVVTGPPPVAHGPQDRPSNTSYLRVADQLAPADKSIETGRDGGFTTAVTFPNANIVSGEGVAFDLAGERAGNMVINPAVGQYLTLKTNGFTSFPGSLMGTIAYLRQLLLDAEQYKTARAIYNAHPRGLARPAYDRTSEALADSPRFLMPANRAVEIDRMLAFAAEMKIKAVLYGAAEAWRSAEALQRAGAPVLVSLKWPTRDREADPADQDPQRILEYREAAPNTPAALAKAGVKFAFYSDGVATPKEMLRAVKKAIDRGLSREDALRALTLSPAEIYGLDDRIGSLDAGKIANLTVTDGDLFDDKTKVKYIFVDGRKFEPAPPDAKPETKPDTKKEPVSENRP